MGTMLRIQIKVIPRSSRDRVIGWVGNRLKVAVTSAPEPGKANEAVIEVLARLLGLNRSAVRIVAGEANPLKTVEIDAPPAVFQLLPPR